jgi:hypothetical protein
MSFPIRKNHIGKIWIPPSLSIVARFAIRVFERRSSISLVLRIGGLFAAASVEGLVIYPFSSGYNFLQLYNA